MTGQARLAAKKRARQMAKEGHVHHIFYHTTAQHLDSRCVLLSYPSSFGAGGPKPKHVSNPASAIKTVNTSLPIGNHL